MVFIFVLDSLVYKMTWHAHIRLSIQKGMYVIVTLSSHPTRQTGKINKSMTTLFCS